MLVPRSHFYSVADCPEPLLRECEELVKRVAVRLSDVYGQSVLMFEHGAHPSAPHLCGSCVEHAHLHLLPGPRTFVQSVTASSHGWIFGSSLQDLRCELKDSAYLLVGEAFGDGGVFARKPDEPVPSQFLRRAFAAEVGDSEGWDWRKHPRLETVLQTMGDLDLQTASRG